ncbi:MAG: DUF4230 domain-containing protein [Candidatus Microthrix sp.]|nr:DUF4230 domain-containing protein [Candidatus Microthrix sp.]
MGCLTKLNQFKAASGTFQVIVDVEKDTQGLPSILAGERTLMVAAGEVDAEVDFSGLKADAIVVDEVNKSVVITVPPPTLTKTRIDNSKTRVYSRERGLLNRVEDFLADQPVDDQPLYVQAEKRDVDGRSSQRPDRSGEAEHRGHAGGHDGLARLFRRDRDLQRRRTDGAGSARRHQRRRLNPIMTGPAHDRTGSCTCRFRCRPVAHHPDGATPE